MITIHYIYGKEIPGGKFDIMANGVLSIAEVYPDGTINFKKTPLEKKLIEEVLTVAKCFTFYKVIWFNKFMWPSIENHCRANN